MILTIIGALSISQLNAGVVILAQAPACVQTLLQNARITLKELIQKHNTTNPESKHLVEIDDYVPHLSLAYVTDKELSVQDLEKREPTLNDDLKQLAASNPIMSLQEAVENAEIVIWKGSSTSRFEGKTFDNYGIFVIKMKLSQELATFVAALDTLLEKHPVSEKRQWPFHPHVTVGYVYHDNDQYPEEILNKIKPELEKTIAAFDCKGQASVIDSIKLSTHDKAQKAFALKSYE